MQKIGSLTEKATVGLLSKGYGIMPNSVLFATSLNSTEKLLFCLISSLTAEKGYCFASNDYLAEKMNKSNIMIRKSIKTLKDKNFIDVSITEFNKRKIIINNFFKNL